MKTEVLVSLCQKASSDTRRANCGSKAAYFLIKKGIGVKYYSSASERDLAYDAQKRWAQLGLAPKVGHKVDLISMFGYITQHAPPSYNLVERSDEYCHSDFVDMVREDYCFDSWFPPSDMVLDLLHQTKKNNMSIKDTHGRNIGFLRGKAVFIDFDCDYSNAS